MVAVCRTCLSLGELSPIFTCPEQHEHYTAVLFITTGLKIELEDGLPQGICHSCINLVNSALRLRDQSHHAQQILLENGFQKVARSATKAYNTLAFSFDCSERQNKKPCDEIGIDISTAPAILVRDSFKNEFASLKEGDLIVKEEVEVQFEWNATNNCDDVEYDAVEDDAEISPDAKAKETKKPWVRIIRSYQRRTPEEKMEARRMRRRLMRLGKPEKPLEKDKYLHLIEGPHESRGPVKCSICKKDLATMNSFVKHVKRHFNREYVCEQCGRPFHTKHGLSNHCMRRHGAEKKLQCDQCEYKAVERSQLVNHVARVHTGVRPYICDICGADFTCKPNVKQHMRTHFAARNVQCDQCPAMFTSRSSLSTHTAKSHRLNYLFYCYLCPKTYSSRCSTRKHLARQHGIARHLQGSLRFTKWNKGQPKPTDV